MYVCDLSVWNEREQEYIAIEVCLTNFADVKWLEINHNSYGYFNGYEQRYDQYTLTSALETIERTRG